MTIERHVEEMRAEQKECLDAGEIVRIEAELEAAKAFLRELFYEEMAAQAAY